MKTLIAFVITWIALVATIAFVLFGLGQNLHAHLLAFPIIGLAIANLLLIKR